MLSTFLPNHLLVKWLPILIIDVIKCLILIMGVVRFIWAKHVTPARNKLFLGEWNAPCLKFWPQ